MHDDKNWVVDVRLSYSVRAHSPDAALGAVLPLISLGRDRYGPQPDVADYTVHERQESVREPTTPAAQSSLAKSVYTAKEVAVFLNISTASVYENIPCMRIGGSRRYSRTVIQEIMDRGSAPKPDPPPQPTPVYHERRRPEKPAKVISKAQPREKPFMKISEVAKMLRLSPPKVRQLIDAKKIHYFEIQGGGRQIRRDAVEHYIKGRTPREFLEHVIAEGDKAGLFKDDPESFGKVVEEWRAAWPGDGNEK
jgi:excisionase family DNA binding protein